VYDLETSRIGAPYTCDISNLRVNNHTAVKMKTEGTKEKKNKK
jgi:hypothetical protein